MPVVLHSMVFHLITIALALTSFASSACFAKPEEAKAFSETSGGLHQAKSAGRELTRTSLGPKGAADVIQTNDVVCGGLP